MGKGHPGQRGAKAKQVVGKEIGEHKQPLALLEIGHGFKCETGKCGESTAEPDYHQQTPTRIEQHALARPDHEEADNEAADHIDEQGAVRKNRAKNAGSEAANEPTGVSAQDGADE